LCEPRTTCEARTQSESRDRSSRKRFDEAHDHRRPEHPAARPESRAEVHDAQLVAARVRHDGLEDRAVAQVTLLRLDTIDQLERERSVERIWRVGFQQRAEHRVGVHAGQAAPDDGCIGRD
jgi:hypothetical protein